jgi:hypothetical protein
MAIQSMLKPGDSIKVSKSFGMVGSSAVNSSKPLIVIAANNNEPILAKEIAINKPLVRMINVLASIDSVLKQKLENAKIIERNNSLNTRESQIEAEEPEVEVIKPDAERVDGSGMGLLAAGGIAALLMLPPVQDAIKEIVDGVVGVGNFVTDIVKSINGAFNFLFGGTTSSEEDTTESESSASPTPSPTATNTETAPQATPASTPQSATPEPQESRPSIMSSAMRGAAVGGSIVPGIGHIVGGTIGGITGVFNSISGGTSSPQAAPIATRSLTTSSPQANPVTPASPPSTTSSSNTRSTATPVASSTATSNATGIPRNDTNDSAAIVRLGRYLQTQGINVSEHSAFDSSIGKHATNSRHYRDRALDLNISGGQEAARFDALRPQLEAAGYTVLWRTKGHHSHMHVSVGGPEGGGSGYYQTGASSLGSTMSAAANMSLEAVGKLFGVLGSAIIKPGIPRTDLGAVIANAAIETNAAVATTRTPTPTPPPPVPRISAPSSPNINRGSSGPTQNVPTTADRNSVYYYLRRFGYQELSRPENVLNMGSLA